MLKKYSKLAIAIFIVVIVTTSIILPARTAHAALGVPISTSFNYHSIMSNLKDFTLDRLATMMAKQVLHQITLSTVNWINSGFKGSPAFLQNPQGFFLDAADQVTGAFIANGGPLSGLCSPFNLDIRLNLALQQSSLINQRYTCTLSKIISAQQNSGVNVSVNGSQVASTRSMQGFIGGDFSQGGWPAFISMTTNDQNNPYGASLQARADVQASISARQASINVDLNRGNGFMSWQSCTDLMTVDSNDYGSVSSADALMQSDPTVTAKANSDGSLTYESCKTQTPGSVISGTLQKQLNVPADELELANNINAVIDALVNQMISQVLNKGLGALSGSSGGRPSYTSQLQAEQAAIYNQTVDQTQQQANASFDQSNTVLNQNKAIYDQAVAVVSGSKSAYLSAKSCFSGKLASPGLSGSDLSYGQNQMSSIDTIIASKVDPLLNTLTKAQTDISKQLDEIQALQSKTMYSSASINAQTVSQTYQNAAQVTSDINSNAQTTQAQAKKDLANAQTMSQQFTANASQFQAACSMFPVVIYTNPTF